MAQLPALTIDPRNALLDLAPVQNALTGLQRQQNANREYDQQQEQLGMQRESHALQKQNYERQWKQQEVANLGKRAQAIDGLTDDRQRQAAWGAWVKAHGADGLSPEEMDYRTGPKLAAAAAGLFRDPMEAESKKLDMDYKRAQIAELNAKASGGGRDYGKTGAVVQGPDGAFYAVRYGADGTEKINRLDVGGQNVAPARGVSVVGNQIYDKATGAPVRDVTQNLAEGEKAKAMGKGQAEGALALPKSKIALDQFNEQNAIVLQNIDTAIAGADGWTTGLYGSAASKIAGTAAHNLSKTLNTIKSNLGFDKLQAMRDASPTGGALGQVSEMENQLLQSVWGSVEQSQTKEQLIENLQQIKAIRERFAVMKQQAYEEDVARFGAQNVPNPASGQAAPAGQDPLAEARDAIAKGAPRDAVIQRLQQNGINPAGL